MASGLEDLLNELKGAPLDRGLDGVAGDVHQRIAEQAATRRQTWRLRTVMAVLMATAATVFSASTAAIAAPDTHSPFAAWSTLAPSTLLEAGE